MANWNEAINIAGLHRLYLKGGMSIHRLAKAVIRKLQNTEAFHVSDPDFMAVVQAFGAVDELARVKDYNVALEMLYEYGNMDHRLWIEAEDVNDKDYDDVPGPTRNPLEEDTSPEILHHSSINKAVYPVQTGNEWVKYQFPREPKALPAPASVPATKASTGFNGHTITCPCNLCVKDRAEADKNLEVWDNTKTYRVGDIVKCNNIKYECIISHCNVDPKTKSFAKPDDPWKWHYNLPVVPRDPELVFKDRITCETKGKPYTTGRKYRYMTEDDFNKKLLIANIEPPTVPKDLYAYWKDSDDPYQDWLAEKWNKGNLTFRAPIVIQ